MKPNKKIVKYIEDKIKILKKIENAYFFSNFIISATIIIINIISIILAIVYLDFGAEIMVKDNKQFSHITSKTQWIQIIAELKLTAMFAIFLILIFIFSMILVIFRSFVFYNKYQKIHKELLFLITKYENNKNNNYSWEDFKQDLLSIEPYYFEKYKRKSLIRDIKRHLKKDRLYKNVK